VGLRSNECWEEDHIGVDWRTVEVEEIAVKKRG